MIMVFNNCKICALTGVVDSNKEIMKNIQAAVFDMDGLLLDTERICCEVFLETIADYGEHFHRKDFIALIGLNGREVRRRLKEKLSESIDFDSLISDWKKQYYTRTVEKAAPLKPGVHAVLKHFEKINLPLAVATSTDHAIADKKLEIAGIRSYFSHLVGGDQVERSKPHPDIYLEVASCLNKDPEECLAFEDSSYGVMSAFRAGMQVVHIPDMVEITKSEQEKCTLVCRDFYEFIESMKERELK
jgi:HAD superfamily hydrolase (TIGR01509 family)